MDTTSRGNITEGVVAGGLMKAGFPVFIPIGTKKDYDLVIEKEGELARVECRTGWLKDGSIRFNTSRSVYNGYGPGKSVPTSPKVEFFGVYCPDTDEVYLVPNFGNRSQMRLRVEPAPNNQTANTRLASDFVLR